MAFLSKSHIRLSLAAVAIACLSACGGGGDGGTGSPTLVVPYTQADVRVAAATGLLFVNIQADQALIEHAFFAGFLQGFINAAPGGSGGATNVPCAVNGVGSGSFSSSVTKTGFYAGLGTNDRVSVTFNSCVFGSAAVASGLTLNGSATMTSRNTYTTLPTAFAVQYDVATTNFDLIFPAIKRRSNGAQSVTFDARASGINLPEINISAGPNGFSSSFFTPASSALPTITNTLRSGANVYSKLGTGNTFISGVNGTADGGTSTSTQSFTLLTNTRLSGSTASGSAVPTSGNLSTKINNLNLQTVVSIQGLNATVQGDTNQDGSLDLNFTTPYTALISF